MCVVLTRRPGVRHCRRSPLRHSGKRPAVGAAPCAFDVQATARCQAQGRRRRPLRLPNSGVIETDAIVLRAIRYGEDSVLTLYTRERDGFRPSRRAHGRRRPNSAVGSSPPCSCTSASTRGAATSAPSVTRVIDAHGGCGSRGIACARPAPSSRRPRASSWRRSRTRAFNVLCRGLAHQSRGAERPSSAP